jgi:hypothetical protein
VCEVLAEERWAEEIMTRKVEEGRLMQIEGHLL